jgi:hypothetical protein
MWSVFELIYKAFKESGIDFMDGENVFVFTDWK